ncbi:hypothetical protein MC885_005485 [Smutsia gigantea]|nr:hypothetical protein MC885_005485 [Smutsia gigantea]
MLGKSRVGTARPRSPGAGQAAPGGRRRRGPPRPGLLPGSPAHRASHRLGRRQQRGWSEAAVGPSWAPVGSRGRCGPRNSAAGDWSPPLQRQRETFEKETSSDLSGLGPRQYYHWTIYSQDIVPARPLAGS